MFYDASEFTGAKNLNDWDVSNVKDMRYMFFNAQNFEQDLCDWGLQLSSQTGELIPVNDMFTGTNCPERQNDPDFFLRNEPGPFCYDCSGSLRVSGKKCFTSNKELRDAVVAYSEDNSRNSNVARKYGYPINRWCVSKIEDFSHVFDSFEFFNDNINGWDVSNAKTMAGMFYNARRFNGDLDNWDVSNVEDMTAMFKGATRFDNDSLQNWDVGRVIIFDSMFEGAKLFNSNLRGWDLRNTISIRSMFKHAKEFDGNLGDWDTSSIVWADSAFERATSFQGRGLNNWDVTLMVDMTSMFRGATSFEEDISPWRPVGAEFTMYTFRDALAFDTNLCSWGNDLRETTVVTQMFSFSSCPEEESPDLTRRIPSPLCHRCTEDSGDCARIGESCRGDNDCGCSALECTNRECELRTRCANWNGKCDRNLDCCDDLECGANGRCQDICTEWNGKCTNDRDCCGGLECGTNGQCRDTGDTCNQRNGRCEIDFDCCSGLQCFGERCLPENCGDIGDTCRVDNDCCLLPCNDGRCSPVGNSGTPCTNSIGGKCTRARDCCNDLRCFNTGCKKCKPAGSNCSRNHVCCSMNCGSNRKCIGNCKKKNKDCSRNKECCSGNCRVVGDNYGQRGKCTG